jgi:hypothetical protein
MPSDKFYCTLCGPGCYTEIFYEHGDNKTKAVLVCPLGFPSHRFALCDKANGEIEIGGPRKPGCLIPGSIPDTIKERKYKPLDGVHDSIVR